MKIKHSIILNVVLILLLIVTSYKYVVIKREFELSVLQCEYNIVKANNDIMKDNIIKLTRYKYILDHK